MVYNESSVKFSSYIIKHQELTQDFIFPPCLFLEFLIDMRMVSEEREYPYEASVKVQLRSNLRNLGMVAYEAAVEISSKSNIRNTVMTLPILQVPYWSLGA